MSKAWSTPTDSETVAKRAGGRRQYNALRQLRASLRRAQVADLIQRSGMGHGYQARIARQLGVSQATVCRDVARLLAAAPLQRCPHCGKPVGLVFRGLRPEDLAPVDMGEVHRMGQALKRQVQTGHHVGRAR